MRRSPGSAGRRNLDLAFLSTVLLAASCPAAVAEGDLAADLVRRVYEDGSWTARLSSFYVRSETVEAAPGTDAAKGSARKSVNEFGFDGKRVRSEWRSDGSISMTLWDGKEGDGPGGTADMVRLAEKRGVKIVRIDPAELPDE